jgi:hypothetical protein
MPDASYSHVGSRWNNIPLGYSVKMDHGGSVQNGDFMLFQGPFSGE